MTVGEPEINLNTWGLKYVRKSKKEETGFGDTSVITGDSSSGFKPSDYSSGGKGSPYKDSKTETLTQPRPDEEQVSSYNPSRAAEADSGSKQTTGGTQDDKNSKFGRGGSLTSGGRVSTSGAPKRGDEAPKTKQPQHPLADNKRDESGNPWKKVTQEGGSTPSSKPAKKNPERKGGQVKPEHAPSTKPTSITRSALDLAIIKCKLLKAKDITASHGYGSSSRYGSENTGSANIVGAGNKKDKAPIEDKTETLASPRPDETEVTSYGEGATGTHGNNSRALKPTGEMRDVKEEGKGKEHGDKAPNTILINQSAEDEIVHKAIELINQAYLEVGKKYPIGEKEAVRPSKQDDDEGKQESDRND